MHLLDIGIETAVTIDGAIKLSMSVSVKDSRSNGFTLVELAIVMIIIGLLIGGILKGQELVENARVNATVAQIKAIQAATATFHDKYNALPGDMINPTGRLSGCAGNCAITGNGDGQLNVVPVCQSPIGTKGERFFFAFGGGQSDYRRESCSWLGLWRRIPSWESFPSFRVHGGFLNRKSGGFLWRGGYYWH